MNRRFHRLWTYKSAQSVKTVVLFGFLGCLWACVGCTTARLAETPAPGTPTFTVMTYNTARGHGDTQRTLDAINTLPADVVCVQEVGDDWARVLQAHRASHLAHIETRTNGTRFGDGMAVLSRYPVQSVADIASDTGWFDAWLVVCDTPAGPVQLLNVHLRPPVSDSGSWVSGYLTTGDDRRAEIERFCAHLSPDLPAIVLGDFNEGDDGDALRWLADQGYTDALREFDRDTHTWAWRTSVTELRRRLDHVAYDARLRCYRAWVERAGGSDHFPVLATFGAAAKNDG